ncbi:MAG: InlB B-repeat-containing protein, partial [Actinomycetales bacterium]
MVVVDTGTATYLGGVLDFTTKPQITFDPNSGDLASGNDVDTATVEMSAEALDSKPASSPTRSGYTFLGWAITSNATTALSTYTVTGNVTLYAVWRVNSGSSPAPVYVPHPPTITSISAPEVCAVSSQLVIKGTWLSGATAKVDSAAARVLASSFNEMT